MIEKKFQIKTKQTLMRNTEEKLKKKRHHAGQSKEKTTLCPLVVLDNKATFF